MELSSLDKTATIKPSPLKPMSKRRIHKNLLVVCLGYFFLFSSYQALANLQSTINVEGNVGVVSQSVIYAALIFSSLFLPKLVIRHLGCKVTLALCALTYAPYMASNFHPHIATFVPASVLLGLGSAPLWSAKCTYLNQLSALYAEVGNIGVEVVTSRFFGVFFMFFQNTQVWGNLVSFLVLRPSVQDDGSPLNASNITCGAGFCSGLNSNLKPPSNEKRNVLIGIYLSLIFVSAIIMGLFLDSLPTRKEEEDEKTDVFSKVAATIMHLKKTDQLLLVPITVFSGVQQAFMLGDFTKAYVGCAWGLHNVGLVFICFGVVNASLSLVAGRLVKHVPRAALMVSGAAGNSAVCIALFLWTPDGDQPAVFFVLVGVWGMSDAIWQTQLNALYGILFRSEEEAGFSNYRLWESLGFSVAFCCSMFLCMTPKIIIVLTFLFVGMLGYLIVELRNRGKKES